MRCLLFKQHAQGFQRTKYLRPLPLRKQGHSRGHGRCFPFSTQQGFRAKRWGVFHCKQQQGQQPQRTQTKHLLIKKEGTRHQESRGHQKWSWEHGLWYRLRVVLQDTYHYGELFGTTLGENNRGVATRRVFTKTCRRY